MAPKTVKISEENYRWLSSFAGELQHEQGRPISLDEAISTLRKGKDLTQFAGSWEMTNKEIELMKKSLQKGWKQWNSRFV